MHDSTSFLHSRYVVFNISNWLLFFLLLFSACQKEKAPSSPPFISFISGSGFVSRDTILNVGQSVTVGIEARGAGVNITYLHIGWSDGQNQTILDSGLNHSSLRYERTIIKTASDKETWTFLVMDRQRNMSTIGLTLQKSGSTQYGEIVTYPDITLGAQNNPFTGSFFSLLGEKWYFLDDAFLHQDSIDIIYYYDMYDATLSSPNESDAPPLFPGPTGLAHWTIKNEIRYDTTTFLPADFDLAQNDSLILAAYEPGQLKRKTKFVTAGMVISFQDASGRIGLIHVKEVVNNTDGFIRMAMKIQK